MSSQADVHSIEDLQSLRTVLALYGEDTLAALGAVDAEVRRTVQWLQQDRPVFWQEQIQRRREQVASAQAEVFRRKLSQASGSTPAMSEQIENLKRAQASLQEAEHRLKLVRKWQPALQQAILEYQASTRRIKDLAAGDVPRAVQLLGRIIDALESYLRVTPPAGTGTTQPSLTAPVFETIATPLLDAELQRRGKPGGCGSESAGRSALPGGGFGTGSLTSGGGGVPTREGENA